MDPPVLMARHDLQEEPFPTASMLAGIMFLVLMMIEARPVLRRGEAEKRTGSGGFVVLSRNVCRTVAIFGTLNGITGLYS